MPGWAKCGQVWLGVFHCVLVWPSVARCGWIGHCKIITMSWAECLQVGLTLATCLVGPSLASRAEVCGQMEPTTEATLGSAKS